MIVALGVYPQLVLEPHRGGHDVARSQPAAAPTASRQADDERSRSPTSKAPEIDYKGLVAADRAVGGSIVVLMVGLFPGRSSSACWCRS